MSVEWASAWDEAPLLTECVKKSAADFARMNAHSCKRFPDLKPDLIGFDPRLSAAHPRPYFISILS